MMKQVFLAFTVVLAVLAGMEAPAKAEPTVTYALDNGLQVVLVPDHRVPKVVMNLRYRVGSMNEPAGRSGFAHLFEHLMFSGTPAWPNVFGAHAALGNEINAWTTEDGTVYYVDGLSSSLPMILSLEADRMANLGRSVTQAKLDLQRSVVKNEMRQNVLDKAGASGWEAFWSGLFPKPHPYSRMVIGSVADLKLVLEDRVPSPIVVVGFSGPVAQSPDNGALSIAAELLGNGEYGFLRNRLVSQLGIATYASASWTGGLLGGRFTFEAGAAEGVAPEALESAMKTAFADFLKTPLDPVDVERARTGILQAARLGSEALKDRAGVVSYNADVLGDAQSALVDDPRVKDASVADVEATMKRLLKPEDASVLVLKPGPRGGYPDALIGSSGTPQPFTAPERAAIDIPKHAAGQAPSATLPAMETATLSNGIKLVHYTMPEAPMVYVAASAAGGWNSVPEGKEGLLELAASMATRGAADRGSADFAKAASDIGAGVGHQAGTLTTMMTLGVPPEKLDQGIGLLADAVLKPRFDKTEWTVLMAQTVDWLNGREADLPGVAGRMAKATLIPQVPGKAAVDWSAKALASISLDEARDAFKAEFTPKAVTFYSVGPMPVATVAASLEKAFGAWTSDTAGYAVEPSPAAHFNGGQKVLLVPEPGASQSALFVARPAPGTDESERAESTAVSNLLGADFSSRLNSVIREEKGYSYGVSSYLMSPMKAGSGLVVATTVERANTGPAITEILKGFAGLTTLPVAQDEVDRTVTVYRRALAGSAETSAGLFSSLIGAVGSGSTLEDQQTRMAARTKLTLDAVQKQALALASLDPSLIVVAGDPDVVMPQLAAIGFKDVEIVKRDEVGDETAMRALDLLGGNRQAPLSASPWRVGDGGTTRAVHSCTGDRDCGAQIHAD
ncbi:pitrilysin family protein [Mesorhizobium sp. LSHC414A00]|uniref:M16 family metallopeptidase n=1 Tax=Mesorhizobium sp. LSHC414A00 TaxID=1287287 RepID=UPI0003CF354B|nr:pitrilysin family protein [Mesorhizobium sp. LSHC414A00]ESX79945.1 hypothetical protein X757_01295 [Mesorhizobium sp. LSHC414A00]